MYGAPPELQTEIYATLPDKFRKHNKQSDWMEERRVPRFHSFLEGPSFDRAGNLFLTDIPYGRIFRVSPKGDWELFADYDGEPNGLKIHKDGRIFVADHKLGLLEFDSQTAKMSVVLARAHFEGFKGLNDLVFNSQGDLFFTDQGQSGLEDPTGRVYRLRASGELDLLFKGIPGPNGILLSPDEKTLYVAATRANRIISMPLLPDYKGVQKCGIFIQLSGSPVGPDGMALDEDGSLAIAHAAFGTVWLFSRFGEPLYRIRSCAGMRTTNAAYGGPERKTLYVTEGEKGVVLKVELPVAGRMMYSHM